MIKTDFNVNREKLEVVMTHIFDAPRAMVWKAYTDPELIPEWWGLGNETTVVERMDVKVGGEWRYIQRDEQGKEEVFYGTYKEIREPELISNTFNYEPIGPGHEVTDTLRLEELDGRTRVTSASRFKTVEDLDGMVASGMESGARESWDRLDALLKKMQEQEGGKK